MKTSPDKSPAPKMQGQRKKDPGMCCISLAEKNSHLRAEPSGWGGEARFQPKYKQKTRTSPDQQSVQAKRVTMKSIFFSALRAQTRGKILNFSVF